VRQTTGQNFVALSKPEANDNDENPEWIWLPNSIVVGAGNEIAPVRLLRRTRNLLAHRLFVDLYGAQSLRRLAGIEWRYPHGILQTFRRRALGGRGDFVVWGFTREARHSWVNSKLLTPYGAGQNDTEASNKFWEAFDLLTRHGLVEFVPHLVSSRVSAETPEPDVLHPLATSNGEPDERAITLAAARAACAILTKDQNELAIEILDDDCPIVPVERDFEQVQLIGIPRLRYRPQTEATAGWHAVWSQERAERVAWFKDMEAAALGKQGNRSAANVRH
jgi:hypothetical protein